MDRESARAGPKVMEPRYVCALGLGVGEGHNAVGCDACLRGGIVDDTGGFVKESATSMLHTFECLG